MAAPSKAEYLKKYLSENAEEKKKKKKRKPGLPPAKVMKSRIVDDDVDFKSLLPENLANTLEEDVGDNEPIVADFIDERPEHVKLLEKYRTSGAWKVLGKDEDNNSQSRRQRHDSESDSDQSSARKQRHDSDSDPSPPRRRRHDSDSDHSPVRRQRHDSDSDQSLPRKQRNDSDSDQSLPRRKRHDSDSDPSPPRKVLKRSKQKRHDSDSDQSPPRGVNNDSDQSPPRRRYDSDQSPIRKQRHDSDSDQSPPRRTKASESVLSHARRKRNNSGDTSSKGKKFGSDKSSSASRRHDSDSDQSPPRRSNSSKDKHKGSHERDRNSEEKKTLSGKRAGLSSAQEMRREAEELKRKEDEKFKQISDDRLGKGAATIFRDKKSGRKRDLAEEEARESEEAKKKAKDDEKFQKWGKGLKQIEQQSLKMEDALHEANKPLARYKDDEDLDQMLRDMDRAEDPMLAFMQKKKSKNAGPPKKEKPRYKGPAPPPNRFGIMPGYRWDGVDRSNGFEKQVYAKQAERKAISEQAYKWSVEDM